MARAAWKPAPHGVQEKMMHEEREGTPVRFWSAAAMVFLVALTLRIALFPGTDGSDGLNYNHFAHRMATGEWRPARDVTSFRYPLIAPIAVSMRLFGVSETSSSLPSL